MSDVVVGRLNPLRPLAFVQGKILAEMINRAIRCLGLVVVEEKKLLRFGRAARYMTSRYANGGKTAPARLCDSIRRGASGVAKKAPKKYKPGQHVTVKLSNGRIEEARINHVIQHSNGTKLQVDFGYYETGSSCGKCWRIDPTLPELARAKKGGHRKTASKTLFPIEGLPDLAYRSHLSIFPDLIIAALRAGAFRLVEPSFFAGAVTTLAFLVALSVSIKLFFFMTIPPQSWIRGKSEEADPTAASPGFWIERTFG